MKITYFKAPADLRKWFSINHAEAHELWVGYHKKGSGQPSVTWPESVDEALLVGWIDGVRKRVDEARYTIRFSPRRPRSIWSAVNIRRVEALIQLGLMKPAGLKAFGARDEHRSRLYSYERATAAFGTKYERKFKQNRAAWAFFQSQPRSYCHTFTWWVVSAKQEATRLKRLARLITASAEGRRL